MLIFNLHLKLSVIYCLFLRMIGFISIVFLFVVCVGGGYWLFTSVFDLFTGPKRETYIDKSVHNHYHTHEHKSISIIDNETKENVFEFRESKNHK